MFDNVQPMRLKQSSDSKTFRTGENTQHINDFNMTMNACR